MKNATSPKARVAQLAELLAPEGSQVEIHGERPKRRGGGPKPPFSAWVEVNNVRVAFVSDRDWRKAYRGLEIKLSKTGVL